ncbi:alpha/beta fold hydrolase [Hymenobacter sp. DG25A]|uniref:alpha/beta fold hydrolase n=1 Tax=Hymenobacter sp. DG25A TaxID=1385663 RepID=UPI0009ECB35F
MKPNLLLLHGALATEAQLKPLARELGAFYRVHTFSFSGHGGRPLVPAEFTMPHFAQEVLRFIQDRDLPFVHVFGYSMGAMRLWWRRCRRPGALKPSPPWAPSLTGLLTPLPRKHAC